MIFLFMTDCDLLLPYLHLLVNFFGLWSAVFSLVSVNFRGSICYHVSVYYKVRFIHGLVFTTLWGVLYQCHGGMSKLHRRSSGGCSLARRTNHGEGKSLHEPSLVVSTSPFTFY
jgi:hypothetical protein